MPNLIQLPKSVHIFYCMQQEYNYLFKIVVIGDAGVGKTNLVSQFVQGIFTQDQKPTVGVEFSSKSCHVNGKDIRCQIWDTAGQQRFRAVTKAYYNGAVGAIVVFDLTNAKTFENVSRWISQAQENTKKDTVILLIGNKDDLKATREVKQAKIETVLNDSKKKIVYMETSALTGHNVEQAFKVLVQSICQQKRIQIQTIKKGVQKGIQTKQQNQQKEIESPSKDSPIKLKSTNFDSMQKQNSQTKKKKSCC